MDELIDFQSDRHEMYEDMLNLFKNEQQEVFLNRIPGVDEVTTYIALALPREIAMLYADLAFRNHINAHARNDEGANNAIDRLIYENDLDNLLPEMALSVAVKGGAVFKNYLDNGQSKITYIEPEYYFPEFSKFDKRRIERETIAFTYEENNKTYLYREIYESRNGEYWCITKVNLFENGKILKQISSDEQNIKLKQSPLTYVPFGRQNSEFYGYSIYTGLLPMFDELNHRVSQISKILDKHSDPNMYADQSFFDDEGQLPSGGKAYPVDFSAQEQPPGYITWDASLEANYKYIKEILFDILYITSAIKPALYGIGKESNQATARAIKLKSWRTDSMVQKSLGHWERALKKVLYLAQELEILSGSAKYTPQIPNIEIYTSLPFDDYEQSQSEQLKAQEGLTSRKSSITRLNPHYNAAEVEQEYLEILNEQAQINNMTFVKNEE